MARTVGVGHQDFETVIQNGYFYVDKTGFIREWWENGDIVTLITRPRRFGKTLNMSMLDYFFSVDHADKGGLFEGLSIWQDGKYRQMQGTYPVISLSFAKVKGTSFASARSEICKIIKKLYKSFGFLLSGDCLDADEKEAYRKISVEMEDYIFADSLNDLSGYLYRYYKKKAIILLDEYDTPMQEAYVGGYWREMVDFLKGFFNATFKTNPCLERALLTGITRISKESLFSDLNNLMVVTVTMDRYADAFGFTEGEVFAALEEYGMGDMKGKVKEWYDGFTFGKIRDIYNPWSILNYLKTGEFALYWVNTSSNALAGKLVREGSRDVKIIMEDLLEGKAFHTAIDEQVVFSQLGGSANAIWSLLLASGYLRVESHQMDEGSGRQDYSLSLTNFEVSQMFGDLIKGWFGGDDVLPDYNDFIKALLLGDVDAMNDYMNRVALATFSSFDTGKSPSAESEPERFYHGFVLGLMVELGDWYSIRSNRESGFGRYDVLLEPKPSAQGGEGRRGRDAGDSYGKEAGSHCGRDAIIIEFKVFSPRREKSLEETVEAALRQIEEKRYEAELLEKGFPSERIKKYGFAFKGKEALIG